MLHIILSILAVIGIILLCIIGLIIILMALILFCPVRYKVYASYHEKRYDVNVKIHWLFSVLCDRININNDSVENTIKVFGFTIGKKDKKENTKKKAEEFIHDVKEDAENVVEEIPEVADEEEKPDDNRKVKGVERKKNKKKRKVKVKKEKTSTFSKVKDFIIKVRNFLKNERNKASIKFIKKQILYLYPCIKPRKIKSDITFGVGDPALTGEALGVLAIIMGCIGQGLNITPDFENRILECEITIKGRAYLIRVLVVALRVLCNKQLKRTFNQFKELKI